jgi:VIT1/CCC1 family predicted Fe2+/Mn2+ transporter
MKASFKTGVSFGLTSGVITTLGLLVGLHAGTHSRIAVLGGILTIAVADALSDALGIHITEEANRRGSSVHVWESTAATFSVKFISAASFALPVLMLPLEQAVIVSVVWGLGLLAVFSWFMARAQQLSPWGVVAEHLLIALVVIAITYVLGRWVGATVG